MKTLNGTRAEAPTMYETENNISLQNRTELNALLNQRLSSAVDLQMAEAVEGYVDEIAERIVQLGGVAEGTVRMAASRTRLTEYSPEISEGMAHVEGVARALSTFGQEARNTISEADELEDADTADLFTEISRGIDKWLWFVEAHSQAKK